MKKHRPLVVAIEGTIDGLVVLLIVLYFLYMTKQWKPWFYGVILFQIIILLGHIWLPESPEFLFAKGRFEESEMVCVRMAKFNGKSLSIEQLSFRPKEGGMETEQGVDD
jgi:hypothetical protein